jgi:hypothetical protein
MEKRSLVLLALLMLVPMPVYANDPSIGGGEDSEDDGWIDDNQTRDCISPIDGMRTC